MTPESPSDPEVRLLSIRGGVVAYTDVGEGPAVIAVHGLPGSVRDYRWLGAALEPRLRFVRIDLPASGGTPLQTLPSERPTQRAELVLRTLDALDISEAVVVGHSYGGVVAMAAAQRFPERCSRVALIASVGRTMHAGFRRIPAPAVMHRLLRTPGVGHLFFPIYRRGVRAAGFRGTYSRTELAHMNACIDAVSFPENREIVSELKVPTLVAWAEDDPLVDTAVSEDLSRAVPAGPRLSWATGGHNLQKSRAVEIADAIVDWIVEP